jgi:hypothetical protein
MSSKKRKIIKSTGTTKEEARKEASRGKEGKRRRGKGKSTLLHHSKATGEI